MSQKDHLSYNVKQQNQQKGEGLRGIYIAAVIGLKTSTLQTHRELKLKCWQRKKVQLINGATWEHCYSYSAYVAQNKYDGKKQSRGPTLKIGHDHHLCEFIEKGIKEKTSPDVLAYLIGKSDEFKVKICTKTIYNYLGKNIFLDVSYDDLVNGHYKKRG